MAAAPLVALATAGCGSQEERGEGAVGPVTVYSTTDTSVFAPVIADFRRLHPKIVLRHIELDAGPLYDRYLREVDGGRPSADIVFSSAMDLQIKLVNDGYAQKHRSPAAASLPAAAKWRDEIFGLTFEPVVMIANPNLIPPGGLPRSRFELVRSLREHPRFWTGRIGTYDIRVSKVGYLLAAQDARLSSEFGSLIGSLGLVEARTYANMAVLIKDVAAGRVVLGYNVLGSYAKRQMMLGVRLQIIYPEDYTLAIVRAAFISRAAPNPAGAHAFMEYLMSERGQRILATRSDLVAIGTRTIGPYDGLVASGEGVGPLRPIPLGPGLLTYLDKQKRERFLMNWQTALEGRQQIGARRDGRQRNDSFTP